MWHLPLWSVLPGSVLFQIKTVHIFKTHHVAQCPSICIDAMLPFTAGANLRSEVIAASIDHIVIELNEAGLVDCASHST